MNWRSTFGDPVIVGDVVALSLLGHPEARGRVVADAGGGAIECVLTECGHCAAGQRVTVEEFNIVMVLGKGEERAVNFDDYSR